MGDQGHPNKNNTFHFPRRKILVETFFVDPTEDELQSCKRKEKIKIYLIDLNIVLITFYTVFFDFNCINLIFIMEIHFKIM